jgi:hypothetical protein
MFMCLEFASCDTFIFVAVVVVVVVVKSMKGPQKQDRGSVRTIGYRTGPSADLKKCVNDHVGWFKNYNNMTIR